MKFLIWTVVLIGLAGCDTVSQRIPGAQEPNVADIYSSAEVDGPVIRVQIPSRGANAELVRVAVSKGVETFAAADNVSISFREGVLVASRGLDFDLMGAGTEGTLLALAGQGEPVYRRQMRYLTGTHQTTYLLAGCTMSSAGREVIDEQRLRRLDERCQTNGGEFTNVFWQNAAGDIIRSRQWISPQIGYLVTSKGNR